jgi:type I restriction enzyme S subunit
VLYEMATNSRRELTLREAGVALYDCDHRTPAPAPQGYPYIAIPQMRDGRLDISEARRISRENWIEWTKRVRPVSGDVIVSRRCNPGESAVVPKDLRCALGQNLLILRSEGPVIDQDFLRWLVRGPGWWKQVQAHLNVGAVFDSLKCEEIPDFRLSVPELEEQRAIASVLGALDDKIDLNRRMNQTLEQIAQSLFKSWFVNFEPVHAKAEGRWKRGESLPGMPADMRDLWPSEFEESETGEIPAGWVVGPLGDVAGVVNEPEDPSSANALEPYIGLEHMDPHCLTLYRTGRMGDVKTAKLRFRIGDILFGRLRPYFHKVAVAWEDGYCSTTAAVVRPRTPPWHAFVLGHLNSSAFIDYATANSNGTTMPSISTKDMLSYQVPTPPPDLIRRLTELQTPLIARMRWAARETRTLEGLCDSLLPKLLSGEIRVPLKGGS